VLYVKFELNRNGASKRRYGAGRGPFARQKDHKFGMVSEWVVERIHEVCQRGVTIRLIVRFIYGQLAWKQIGKKEHEGVDSGLAG